MTTEFQPPPTWAPVTLTQADPATGRESQTFNPVWLKWFVDVAGLISAAGGGGDSGQIGNVVGPSVSVANNVAAFDNTDGKTIKDSGLLSTDIVKGPATSVLWHFPRFADTTGKLLEDSGTLSFVFVDAEVPTGVPNGILLVFTLAGTPSPAGSLILGGSSAANHYLYLPGVDYTLVGDTITFGTAPAAGITLTAWYRK